MMPRACLVPLSRVCGRIIKITILKITKIADLALTGKETVIFRYASLLLMAISTSFIPRKGREGEGGEDDELVLLRKL